MDVDYLVISQNPKIEIEDLMACFDFEKVIIDNSNPYWKVESWVESCKNNSIDYHLVKTSGAWECRIKNKS
jgi:hypothetical protein